MNNQTKSLLLALLLILLAACQPAPVVETQPEAEMTPGMAVVTPQTTEEPGGPPESGKSTVTGQVISNKTNSPLVNIGVRLAEVHRQDDEGAFLLDTAFSPGDFTDEDGYFNFVDITPGEYVLVVGNVEIYQGYEIIPDSSGKPLVYNFPADQVTEIGTVTVNLDPMP